MVLPGLILIFVHVSGCIGPYFAQHTSVNHPSHSPERYRMTKTRSLTLHTIFDDVFCEKIQTLYSCIPRKTTHINAGKHVSPTCSLKSRQSRTQRCVQMLGGRAHGEKKFNSGVVPLTGSHTIIQYLNSLASSYEASWLKMRDS